MTDSFIHTLADVKSKHIGAGSRIWQFVVVLAGAKIGQDCNICSHCLIENDVVIGDRVTVKSGVQLWDGLRVGDDVFIGPNASFANDRFPRSRQKPEKFLVTTIHDGASVPDGGGLDGLLNRCLVDRTIAGGAGDCGVARRVPAHKHFSAQLVALTIHYHKEIMDYNLLAGEIENDPSGAGYATMTDAEIAASLSAQTIRIRQRVPIERLQAVAMETGVYSALKMAIKKPDTPPELGVLCETALDLVSARFPDIDLDNPAAAQMFGTLRQYGVISTQQAEEIDRLATRAVASRSEQIGLGAAVSVEDIERSRIVPALDGLRQRLRNGYNAAVASLDAAQIVPEWREIVAIIEVA